MYKFRLYVMDRMIKAIQVVEDLTVLLEDALDGNYELEVIDIIENPELAERDEIVATPTLVKVSAEPVRMIIGDWLDKKSILSALGLTVKCREVVKMSKRILVIDDEEGTRMSFVLALRDTEFEVDTAESGEKALEMKSNNEYDLIFLDLKMPGMNGVETLREIRKTDEDVPIYIFTAFHREFLDELKIAQKEMLKFEVLKKPIGSELIVTLAKLILKHPENVEESSYV